MWRPSTAQTALETLALELKPWRNWYVDVANEHNLRGTKVSKSEGVRRRAPFAIV